MEISAKLADENEKTKFGNQTKCKESCPGTFTGEVYRELMPKHLTKTL